MRRAYLLLSYRFKARKALIIFTRCKKTFASMKIQRCYRAHVAWLKWLKEQLLLFYAAQRANAAVSLTAVDKIQYIWRKYYRIDRKIVKETWKSSYCLFSRHILLLFRKEHRKKHFKRNSMAVRIQNSIRSFLVRRRILILRWQHFNANKLWAFTKAYLLKLALYDRVEATKARKNAAANKIKINFRKVILTRKLMNRFINRKLTNELIAFRNLAIILIQRLHRRKFREYYMPLRKAARLQLLKYRAKKHIEFQFRVFDKASRVCQKFGLNIIKWNRIMSIIKYQRRKLHEWRYKYYKIQIIYVLLT